MKEERIILKLKEKLSLSDEKHGIVCLTGHVGIAHAHGANNYQQDDGGGFCAAGTIVSHALSVDTRIREVSCTTEKITVVYGRRQCGDDAKEKGHAAGSRHDEKGRGKDALFSQGVVEVFDGSTTRSRRDYRMFSGALPFQCRFLQYSTRKGSVVPKR